jgi:hypothetical protein
LKTSFQKHCNDIVVVESVNWLCFENGFYSFLELFSDLSYTSIFLLKNDMEIEWNERYGRLFYCHIPFFIAEKGNMSIAKKEA